MRTHEYRDIICSLCNCKHLTAEEVFLEVKKIEPKIGKATVYRNLEDMSSSGMIRKVPGVFGKSYFEATPGAHAHLIFEDEEIIEDFPLENIQITGIPEGYSLSEIRICLKKDTTSL